MATGRGRPILPHIYHGVLCLDGVEISTNGGHYVALGMQPSPYPLGGEPVGGRRGREAARRVRHRRASGFAESVLAWTDWDATVRRHRVAERRQRVARRVAARLADVLFNYMFRPAPALASMLDRPVQTLKRWDDCSTHRRVVGLAGVDAHGGIGRGMEEGGKRRPAFGHVPLTRPAFERLQRERCSSARSVETRRAMRRR